MEYKSLYKSPLGVIILTSDGEVLTGLWFETSRFLEHRKVKEEQLVDELKIFNQTKTWLDKYFEGKKPDQNEIQVRLDGTTFSRAVWEILKKIPYGETITYGDIAKKIEKQNGSKMSAQAVGHAVGHNPISIIIPCHRVVGTDGNLTGYGGGLDVKIGLLENERVDMTKYYRTKRGKAM